MGESLMSSLHPHRPRVEVPSDPDGLLIPRLLPVAAYLCVEGYPDRARERVLSRLADGVSPRACCRDGALEWRDLAEVERLLAGARRPYDGEWPRDKTAADRRADADAVRDWYRDRPGE
jgi:hypothetical protein